MMISHIKPMHQVMGTLQFTRQKQPAVVQHVAQYTPPLTQATGSYGRAMVSFSGGLDPDHERFKKITRRGVRDDLDKFLSPDDIHITKDGKHITIPKKTIEQPHFTRGGFPTGGGVGSGQGNVGDQVQPGQEEGEGGNKAGEQGGEHTREDWENRIHRNDIAKAIIEKYKLPNLQAKGSEAFPYQKIKWTQVHRTGQMLLQKETFYAALKRTASEIGGDETIEDEDAALEESVDNGIEIMPQDLRFRTYAIDEKPKANAVIFYMMDVSGSVTDAMKQLARKASFYTSTIIQSQFGKLNAELRDEIPTNNHYGEGVVEIYIIHDSNAKEVSESEFFTTSESGGTKISSALELMKKMITKGVSQADGSIKKFDPEHWNIYGFYFGDGDNWGDDTPTSLRLIDELIPMVNEFAYTQMESPYGSGEFYDYLEEEYGSNHDKVRLSKLTDGDNEEFGKMLEANFSERASGTPVKA